MVIRYLFLALVISGIALAEHLNSITVPTKPIVTTPKICSCFCVVRFAFSSPRLCKSPRVTPDGEFALLYRRSQSPIRAWTCEEYRYRAAVETETRCNDINDAVTIPCNGTLRLYDNDAIRNQRGRLQSCEWISASEL